jgi:hypothetical protein
MKSELTVFQNICFDMTDFGLANLVRPAVVSRS